MRLKPVKAVKRCSDGAAQDDIKQKETKGTKIFPEVCVQIESLFSLLSSV
jgi:hypothetical protein